MTMEGNMTIISTKPAEEARLAVRAEPAENDENDENGRAPAARAKSPGRAQPSAKAQRNHNGKQSAKAQRNHNGKQSPNPQPAAVGRTDELLLVHWNDKRRDPYGHDLRSTYVEQFWLSTLGPSTTWFLRICANALDDCGDASVNLTEVARTLGIGYRGGARSAMLRTVARACRFGAARPAGVNTLAVRRRLPLLNHKQLKRLPLAQQRRHEQYITSDAPNDCVNDNRLRARRLALSLVECGDSPDNAEMQLGRWNFDPAVAADAVRWAWSRPGKTA